VFIVSASRKPPGQVSKRLDFWSSFSQSWGSSVSFLEYFSAPVALREHFGFIFGVTKTDWGTNGDPRGTKGTLARYKVTHLETFWDSFFVYFLIFLRTKWFLESVCFFM
jgi:hypothetical protein